MGYLRPTPFSVRSVSAGRVSRRRALARLTQVGAGAMLAALPGGGARSNVSEVLEPTPSQVEGPFYPQNKPVDADWNLLDVASASVPPAGKPLGLQGRVLDTVGRPLAHTTVEIWQSDNQGVYDHPRAEERDRFDRRFQGYGASATGNEGRYRFLTIMPVPYTGRPAAHPRQDPAQGRPSADDPALSKGPSRKRPGRVVVPALLPQSGRSAHRSPGCGDAERSAG